MKNKGLLIAVFCIGTGVGEVQAVGDGFAKLSRPMLQLSDRVYPDGVADEATYRAWLANRRREILDPVGGAAGDSCRLASIHLAAVNWMLSRETEPFVSAYLHDLELGDRSVALRILSAAEEQLSLAAASLDGCEEDDEVLTELEDASETLSAFGEAIRGLLDEHADQEAVRDGALSLSLHLESSIDGVPMAAKLLQACLFAKSDRKDLALRVLPKIGADVSEDALYHEYFSRLLRCRQILNRGGHAAVWSLLLLCEELAIDRFDDEGDQAEAVRSASAIKIDACRSWVESSSEDQREATLAWCESAVSKLSRDVFAGDTSDRLLRLPFVLPIIVDPIPVTVGGKDGENSDSPPEGMDNSGDEKTADGEPENQVIEPK